MADQMYAALVKEAEAWLAMRKSFYALSCELGAPSIILAGLALAVTNAEQALDHIKNVAAINAVGVEAA